MFDEKDIVTKYNGRIFGFNRQGEMLSNTEPVVRVREKDGRYRDFFLEDERFSIKEGKEAIGQMSAMDITMYRETEDGKLVQIDVNGLELEEVRDAE